MKILLKMTKLCLLALAVQSSMGYAEEFHDSLKENQSFALNFHDVRDDVLRVGDRDPFAISSKNLADFLAWLSTSKWQPVTLKQILEARQGKTKLPEHAVLLSFDDGMLSSYSHTFPLLKQYQLPAVFAIVTSWTEGSNPGGEIAYGKNNMMTWAQMREMQASGLVEFASHSHSLHQGVIANPQNNEEPAAISRQYFHHLKRYETDQEYRQRIYQDLATSKKLLDQNIGINTIAMIWPYGAVTPEVEQIAHEVGLPLSFSLGDTGLNTVSDAVLRRYLVNDNPTAEGLRQNMLNIIHYHDDKKIEQFHSIGLNLNELVEADPQQADQKLGAMLNSIQAQRVDRVVLNVLHQDKNGIYAFVPNSIFPVKQDLMNRMTWQMMTRTFNNVYAQIPMAFFTAQPDYLARFSADLMKNNTRLLGIQFDTADQFAGYLQPSNVEVQRQLQMLKDIKKVALHYSSVSYPFDIALAGQLNTQDSPQFIAALPTLLQYVDFIDVTIQPNLDKKQWAQLQQSLQPLAQNYKNRIAIHVDLSNLNTPKDWQRAQQFLVEMQRLGLQNIGVQQYGFANRQQVFEYLYDPLSQNDSPVLYQDPYFQMTQEKSP
ncbi:poly-beta-1,6-N-acetyl-D-glucosamine N-deacetylase PgaB [Acinetobacter larvae]|uniref:Poly-beta-1,6-N-acetyl-D-glucosamine N-deacetylase PgaB n=1 Tax=Acinetobacter larvae TaxID=1789224 RepID=A0A1B2LYX7_9GAMM|nr:poly-beta-1,6-N-acetyl-D-glucosamine N-deacetylase PgaB [Acinetobacter larvae]AOA58135.1 poly-beta-1,6-N-acetyl-D-glucosamine N-deacetylase PgaB [Acinetobacter larvae]